MPRKIFEYNPCKLRHAISLNSDLILKTQLICITDFDMNCCGSDQVDKIVAEAKEYNMWADDIWRDIPRISNPRNEWIDVPNTSPIKPRKSTWSPPKTNYCSTPTRPNIVPQEYTPPGSYTPPITPPDQPAWMPPSPKSTPPNSSPEFQWKTPEKSENPSMEDLDTSPRTSTPVSNESQNDILSENTKDQYECFKVHLHESPKKLKIRGSASYENETIIAGHIDMKNLDPFSYTYEQYYMPRLNQCFVNLLINGPAPLMCHEHYDPNFPNNFVANCHCIPVCNCRVNLATNRNLPIGYKYDEHGFVVPTMPSMPPRAHNRNPNCIYTA